MTPTPTEGNELDSLYQGDSSPSSSGSADAPPTGSKIKSMWRRNKRRFAAISMIVGLLSGAGGMIGFLKVFEVAHIMNNLYPANFGLSEDMEGSRATRLLQSKLNADGSNRVRTGNPVSDKVDNLKLDRLFNKMEAKGYKFEYVPQTNGKQRIASYTTPDGDVIRIPEGSTPRQFIRIFKPVINDNIPVWRVGKRFSYREMIRSRAGYSWGDVFGRKIRNTAGNIKNHIRGIDDARSAGGIDAKTIDADGESSTNDTVTTSNNDVNEALRDISADVASGKDIDLATTEASRKFGAKSGSSIVLGSIILTCLASNYAESLENFDATEYERRSKLAAKSLNLWHQLQSGNNVYIEEINEVSELYHEIKVNDQGEAVNEDFDQSAAWKRTTGQEVTGAENDFGLSADPESNSDPISKAVNSIGSLFSSIPGFSTACSFVGNRVVQFIADAAERIGAFVSGGTLAVIKSAGGDFALERSIGFLFGKLAFPTASIADGPVNFVADVDLSLNASNAEYTRDLGGPPLSNAQWESMELTYRQEQEDINSQRSFYARYLSPSNHRSVMSKSLAKIPTTGSSLVARINPQRIFGALFKIRNFIPGVHAEQGEFDNYGIKQFGFTDEDLEIDPVENSEYIYKRIKCAENPTSTCGLSIIKEGIMTKNYFTCMDKPSYLFDKEPTVGNNSVTVLLEDTNVEASISNTKVNCHQRSPLYVRAGLYRLDERTVKNLECLTTDTPCGTTLNTSTSGNIEVANGTAQELARQVLEHPKIKFQTSSIRQSFVQVAETGSTATYSINSDTKTAVSPRLLKVLLAIASEGIQIDISSLATGQHSTTSLHYRGLGVDIGNEDVADKLMPFVFDNRESLHIDELFLNVPNYYRYNVDNGVPINVGKDLSNHIHIGVFGEN